MPKRTRLRVVALVRASPRTGTESDVTIIGRTSTTGLGRIAVVVFGVVLAAGRVVVLVLAASRRCSVRAFLGFGFVFVFAPVFELVILGFVFAFVRPDDLFLSAVRLAVVFAPVLDFDACVVRGLLFAGVLFGVGAVRFACVFFGVGVVFFFGVGVALRPVLV